MISIFFLNFAFEMERRSYNDSSRVTAINAYMLAQKYYKEFPSGILSRSVLKKYDYRFDKNVQLTIESEKKDTLSIKTFHLKGDILHWVRTVKGEKKYERIPIKR